MLLTSSIQPHGPNFMYTLYPDITPLLHGGSEDQKVRSRLPSVEPFPRIHTFHKTAHFPHCNPRSPVAHTEETMLGHNTLRLNDNWSIFEHRNLFCTRTRLPPPPVSLPPQNENSIFTRATNPSHLIAPALLCHLSQLVHNPASPHNKCDFSFQTATWNKTHAT